MKEKKHLSLKNALLSLAFLLVTTVLTLTNTQDVYATESSTTVEINGVNYYFWSEEDFEDWYDYDSSSEKDNAILSLYNTYKGFYSAGYISTPQNKATTTLTIENTINGYPVVMLWTRTETEDEYETLSYNETITTLNLPANIVEFDATEWKELKTLTISPDNSYYSVSEGILYNKKQTEVISYLNATTFNMPSTVTTLPENFSTKLKAINVNKANKKYSSKDGVLYNKKKTKLIHYPYGKTTKKYKMPSSVKTIEQNVLDYHPYLQTMVMSKNITKIFDCCNGMKKLKSVTLPKKVKYIAYAFNDCDKLKKAKIPSSCKYMSFAFASYKKKKTITIDSKKITMNIQCKSKNFDTFSVKKGTVITLQIAWGSKIKSKNTKIASVSTVKNDEKLVKIKTNAKGTTTIYDSEDSTYKLILKVR